MKKIIAVAFMTLGIQACANGAPSASDVAKSLKAERADCPNIVVENVKIVNGMKVNDYTHRVAATFDLRVIPMPPQRVQAAKAAMDAWHAESNAIGAQNHDLQKQYADLDSEGEKVGKQVNDQLTAEGFDKANDAYFARREVLNEQYGSNRIMHEKMKLDKQIHAGTSAPQPRTQTINLQKEWGSDACVMKSGVKWVGQSSAIWDAITKGAVNSFELTFTMRKTDNGWVKVN